MKKWFAYGAIFLSVYLAFVITLMPASFVLSYVNLPKDINIQKVEGSIWQANISEIHYKKLTLNKVSASLSIWSLLVFDPTLSISFGDPLLLGPEGKFTVSGLLSELKISQGQLLVSANEIAKQLRLPIPMVASGDVNIHIETFMLGKPICQQAQGSIAWKKAKITAFEQTISLGKLGATLNCEQGALALTIDPKNDLGLTFTAYVRSRGVSGNGFLTPSKKFPPALKTVLPFLGSADNKGRYRLSF